MSQYYILENGKPVKCDSVIEWARWFETNEKVLIKTKLKGDILISTVFLGLNHQWGVGPPLIWETMIFGGSWDEYLTRSATEDEALVEHFKAVKKALGLETE